MSLIKAIIFDFDGTLVDSEKAIYECFQSITKQLAPERMEYAKNILIGPPLRETASEILGFDYQDQLDKFVNLFIEMHDEEAIKHTQPYPDVANVLHDLHKNNVPMAVATNKRQAPTIKLIDHFGWKDYFKFIECSDSKPQMRNKEGMIQDILKHDNSLYGALFIGDTVNDVAAALDAGLPVVAVDYGYSSSDELLSATKVVGGFFELSLAYNS